MTIMTTANKVTIGRIVLIPFFVFIMLDYIRDFQVGIEHGWQRYLAVGIFVLAAVCDGVDGYIARRYNQWSELGTILDPLADKLLLVSAIVVLSFPHHDRLATMPLWLTGTIIGRDLLLGIGSIVIWLTVGKIKVRPRMTGKIATVLQMATVLWILLKWSEPHALWLKYLSIGAAVSTGMSGLLYVFDGMKQLGAHPSSSAKK